MPEFGQATDDLNAWAAPFVAACNSCGWIRQRTEETVANLQ
ncbi:hypothetical protein [Nocardia abscessus]|nr:hypothetical protein [Nocardia abscessus]